MVDSLNADNGCYFYISHDDDCTVYLNGQEIFSSSEWTSSDEYLVIPISATVTSSLLRNGDNVLAVKTTDTDEIRFIDFGLYDSLQEEGAFSNETNVKISIDNDDEHPWNIFGNYIENRKTGKSSSSISFTYTCQYMTEVSFDWYFYNYYNHLGELYIDGTLNLSNQNYQDSFRKFLEPGTHVITFVDSMSTDYDYYVSQNISRIKNIKVRSIPKLEDFILTEKSESMTFENDTKWPWTVKDGYIQSSNYSNRNSCSRFRSTITVAEPSKLSFWSSTYYYSSSEEAYTGYSGYHYFGFKINGETYMCRESGKGITSVMLEPGTYTLEWCDSIYNTTANVKSRVSDIELSSNWVNVDVASNAGTLGVEALYLVNVLNDIELLNISGTLNSADLATIKQMKNLVGLDLTNARFDNLPDYAFDGLQYLSSVKLPEGVQTIGEYAFKGTQLLNIDIPSSVTSIGQYAFSGTRVRTVNFKLDSQLQSIGYSAFCGCTSLEEFIMPNTVTHIATYNNYSDYECSIFYGCTSLSKLHFSDALTTLGRNICYSCNNLKEIHFPSNLISINNNAFFGCGVDSLILPVKLSTLGSYAFQNCDNLEYIELPSSIDNYYCNFYGCSAIKKVVCKSATPPTVKNDPFEYCPAKSTITLVVPSFAVVNYKLDSYWYQFGSIQEMETDCDFWRISGNLSLLNNRRMNGKPDIELLAGGKLTVSGPAPMKMGLFKMEVNNEEGSNNGALLNYCPEMTADTVISTYYADRNTWQFITPLHNVKLNKITADAASYVFRYYDGEGRAETGTGNSWKNVEEGGELIAGQGYILHGNSDGWFSFPSEKQSGAHIFTTEDFEIPLQVHESTAKANKNWNYVGNPYPAYYDIYYMDFTAPITVWTGSTYKAYSIADDDYVLRPMQSFFVQKPDEIDRIVFRKEGRQISSTVNRASYAPVQDSASQSRLFFNLAISDDSIADETRIVLNDSASADYEIRCDASKFMSMETATAQIFSIDANGQQYAINERPAAQGEIRLGYYAGAAGFYTISATRADGDIILVDKKLNKCIDLTAQDYTFSTTATAGTDDTRFSLVISASSNITSVEDIIGSTDGSNIRIFNLEGKLLNADIKSLPAGVYLVNANGNVSKVAVNQ